jgi:hypothetical protein
MGTTSIIFPEIVSLQQLVEWNRTLWNPSNELEIRIDFRNTRFFTPFAMMFICQQIHYYKKMYKAAILIIENYEHLGWPERMQFFSTLGPEILSGKKQVLRDVHDSVGPHAHPTAFLPITTLLTKNFKDDYGRSLSEINEAVDRRSALLAQTLTQLGSGYTFDIVQYSLREIIRNVFEHSGSEILRYCAQYWKKTSTVELIISDTGMGVYQSLIGNASFKKIAERDALHFACLPGVSGNARALKERASSNPWRNSGYGLYMTSRLCRNNGDFLIISNNHALFLGSNSRKNDFSVEFTSGTLIRLHLKLDKSQNLRADLARYTEEGKRIAEAIRGAKVLEASAASQMLRRDFEK